MTPVFRRFFLYALPALAVVALWTFWPQGVAFAQDVAGNLSTVGDATGLGTEDPRLIAARLIRSALMFLGVIAVVLVMYGGWLWMTSGGSEEQVTRAKRVLVNALIGLVLILLSVAIVSFVMGAISRATGAAGGNGGGGGGGGIGLGGGSATRFEVTGVAPVGTVPIRNVRVQITFSAAVDSRSIEDNVRLFAVGTNDRVNGELSVQGNRVTFTPADPCPEPNQDRQCFAANAEYGVSVLEAIRSASGKPLDCSNAKCTSRFTTGDLVDVENPTTSLTQPGDGSGVSQNAFVTTQAEVRDDAGVAIAEFFVEEDFLDAVPAPEGNPLSAILSSLWDTGGRQLGELVTISTVGYDIAGNTTSDAARVRVRGPWCFNGVIDANQGETGIDCGGNSADAAYCGACAGGSCVANEDCGGGAVCENERCVLRARIDAFSPPTGAPGTFVTLSGVGLSPDAVVTFAGVDDGRIRAAFAGCGVQSGTQLTVVVPDGAVDGSIRVEAAAGTDDTMDAQGPLLPAFLVNGDVRPNLCTLQPATSLTPQSAVTYVGERFGSTQNDSGVTFLPIGVTPNSYSAWNDGQIQTTVPTLRDGTYRTAVIVNGLSSNEISVRIDRSAPQVAPRLTSIAPETGSPGQYLTLSGSGFGSQLGTIWFTNTLDGVRTAATPDFPEECEVTQWTDAEIATVIPDDLPLGNYTVHIERPDGAASNAVAYAVIAGTPGPNVCALVPNQGLPGDEVRIIGGRFGTPGAVTFTDGRVAEVIRWAEDALVVRVPPAVLSGPVTVRSADDRLGNPKYFTVGVAGDGAAAPRQAAYAWTFSTGSIPAVPAVVHACTDTAISAVPSAEYAGGDAVCLNAVVYAEFTVPMNPGTLDDALIVERCTGGGLNRCGSTELVAGTVVAQSQAATFRPEQDFLPDTLYRVTVAKSALSVDGVGLARDDQWTFTTGAAGSSCLVQSVTLRPQETLLDVKEDTAQITALPRAGCVALDRDDYAYSWTLPKSFVREEPAADPSVCAGSPSACVTVGALSEGRGEVTAVERASSIAGAGSIVVNYVDPYVTEAFPACTEACRNGLVGARFNVPMEPRLLERSVFLEQCTNELCSERSRVAAQGRCLVDDVGACVGFSFTYGLLEQGTFYRVTIPGSVTSASGAPLTGLNQANAYVFTFRTREDASVCRVERVGVLPGTKVVHQVGERVVYSAEAFGAPDSCSVSGQRLEPMSYDWQWERPIADENNDRDAATRVAAWLGNGRADVMSQQGPIAGCTAACVATGSLYAPALCGDGRIGLGEECEDGNVESGDGCSAACLREGSGVAGAVCGDGDVTTLASGAGEECDDGNVANGDGCSALCVREGARAVGAKCGNNDIARNQAGAGEDCDDGNAANGDGCSAICLLEGSATLVDLQGAACGNGLLEAPYEECDDANGVNGDGCSARCLKEGLPACSNAGGVGCCGNSRVESAEQCDDGNSVSGDGCSQSCVLEGSSVFYATPSLCGDGIAGVGESAVCEAVARGDSRVDPVQVAQITRQAPAEVDLGTQEANATVRATAGGLTGEGVLTLQCSARFDRDCSDPATTGVGGANCCMDRPIVTLSPAGSGICRNAALVAYADQSMDIASFTAAGREGAPARFVAVLDTSTVGGVCPSDHRTVAAGALDGNWWATVRSWLGVGVAGAADECYAPVIGMTQVPTDDGRYAVYLRLNAALAANAKYTLRVEGDDAVRDDAINGVRAENGAALGATTIQEFTTGATFCGLDEVAILDGAETPYFFGSTDESHIMSARGYSSATGARQEIQQIPGVYTWDYAGWTTDVEGEVFATAVQADSSQARVTAVGQNGSGTLLTTATIAANTLNIAGPEAVMGTAELSAFLCENPWPNPALGERFPWRDTDLNVAVSYCRDAGEDGVEDDLPALSVVRSQTSAVPGVISLGGRPAEYLFRVPASGDAVGLRFFENGSYLSPEAWYESRGFSGSPDETEVDGFRAVRDGRSTYIAVANQDPGARLYSNIALLSYNQDTGDDLSAIYEQFLDNITFIRNVRGAAVCVNDRGVAVLDAGKARACTSDFSCTDLGAVCGSNKDRVRRDLARHLDAVLVRDAVEEYAADNGTCSATSDRLCQSVTDCPVGESCVGIVPALASGTFVRGAASSTWSSWQEILGGALQSDLPLDPLNQHLGCGQGDLASYDPSTCYSAEATRYTCPAGSSAYYYRTTGLRTADLLIDLEYDNGVWVDDVTNDGSPLTVEFGASNASYCVGRPFGAGGTCGDGVVGANEQCEPGQVGGSLVACDRNGDGTNDGYRAERCTAACVFAPDEAAACVAPTCGDGVVDAAEQCDDGVNNGLYGYCGADCQSASRTFCGDGVLSGQEVCDCGSVGVASPLNQRRAFGGALTCANVNGAYGANPATTCAWDCRGAAGYCGDSVVNGAEMCDGTAGLETTTYTGAVCTGGANDGQACTNDGECGAGRCGSDAVDRACVAGQQRTRGCTDSCQIPAWSACQQASTRNGIVEAGEACDDGNESDNDFCKNDFTVNVCGDGVMNPSVEQCDVGAQNGQECTAEYGSTCSACSTSCRLVVQSGDYCGDGERNGQEYCDAGAVPLRFVNLTTDALGAECSTPGVTQGAEVCGAVGVCNGGSDNGGLCLVGGAACAGGGECVTPQCGASCLSACPATFQSASLGVTPNQPGARPTSSVALYSYETFSQEPGAIAQVPNVGTITIPACRAASRLRADVRTSGITRPDAYVVFVTDRSGSMSGVFPDGSTRMTVTRSALEASVGDLFDELGESVHIALVSYSGRSGQGICQGGNYGSCDSDADCANGLTCDLLEGFYDQDDETALLDMIGSYTPFDGTNTHLGLDDARALLRDRAPAGGANPPRKVVVLLTDGDANDSTAARIAANNIKTAGYEFYTIGITNSGSFIDRLNGWSSNGPDNWDGSVTVANPPAEGTDYSFSGTTSEQVRSFYGQIVDSITGFTLTLVGLEGGATVIGDASGTVTFTLPSTFRCDPLRSQPLPIKPIFRGLGTLEILNVRFDHCPL